MNTHRAIPACVEPLETRIAPAAVASIALGGLDGTAGFKISGIADSDAAGISVSGAGDVNGDGFADLLVGAILANEGGADRGAAYVVFGKPGGFSASVALSALDGSDGFKLSGVADFENAGISVSAAGDVNGDGFADLLIGATYATGGVSNSGAAYVVFGQADFSATGGTFDLSALNGSDGFKLSGVADSDHAGGSVSAAGDVNGDGFADLLIGARSANEGGANRGAAYVVFGKPGGFAASVALSALNGSDGFKLSGGADFDSAGGSVSAAGDVNGDGFADLLIGATGVEGGSFMRGAAYVIFGKAGGFSASVALSALDGSDGFKLSGAAGDFAGSSVSAAGDVNGDGFADLLVGASAADEGGTNRGAAYVVFGKAGGFSASVALSALNGSDGFKLSGVADNDRAGVSVSTAGDVNGDGFADLLVGAYAASTGAAYSRGAAYVVFGKPGGFGASVALSGLNGSDGFKLSGVSDYDSAGTSVSTAGDVNGDGFDDLIIGAPNADEGGTNRGAAYVVFGFGTADIVVGATGKTATFTDWDGDLVTIKTTKGPLTASQFHLSSPNPLTGGAHLLYADFTGALDGTGITLSAKRGPTGGDGLVNVGTLDARGVALGKVSIDGDLQQLDADAVAGLTVYSLGQFAGAEVKGGPLASEIDGRLGALTVKTDASRVTLAAGTFGAIKAARLDGVSIFALGAIGAATPAQALAIKSLTIGGTVRDSHILAGYNSDGLAANADVQIGKVVVKGQWIASDLVAGVTAGVDGIFANGGASEIIIPGGNAIVAKIASITIAGAVFGTPGDVHDGFGFAAEEIGSFSVGKAKLPLQPGARNDTTPILVGLTGDVRVREVA